MKINTNTFNYKNNTKAPAFKHKIILDIGASSPRGSLKVLVTDDEGNDIFKKTGSYVNNTPNGFESPQDFTEKVIEIIKNTHQEAQSVILQGIESGKYKAGEEKLTDIGIFVPGTTMGDSIAFMPNLKDKEEKSLKNVDFSNFKKSLLTKAATETGIEINKDNFGFVVTKDLGGAGIGIAQILAQRNELHDGDYIMGIMTGGGFGSVDIKVKNNIVEVETSESSSYLTHDFINHKMEKLGRLGVTVKSHIGFYMKAIGLPELTPLVLKAGDARIVTLNEMYIDNSNQELIDQILAKSKTVDGNHQFKIKRQENGKTVLMLDDSDTRFRAKMKRARVAAINNYADSVSLIAVNKINDCLNKIILVGPFAHGVNQYVIHNPNDFDAKDLPSLINNRIDSRIDEVDLPSSRELKKLYDLKVICDDSINFPDNTFAGYTITNNKLKFVQNRGSWFSMPLTVLKDLKPNQN